MNKDDFELLANMLSKKTGIICQSHKESGWKVNPKDKIIYYPEWSAFDETDFGTLIHEVAHLRFSQYNSSFKEDFEKMAGLAKEKSKKQIWELVNALEDIRIETKMCKLYAGAKDYFLLADKTYLELQINSALDFLFFEPQKYAEAIKDKLWWFFCVYETFRQRNEPSVLEELLKSWSADKNEKLLKAIKEFEPLFKEIYEQKTTLDLVNFIGQKVLPIYLPLCTDEKDKEKAMKLLAELLKQFAKFIKKCQKTGSSGSSKIKKLGKATGAKSFGGHGANEEEEESKETRPPIELDISLLAKEVQENWHSVRKALSILKDKETTRYEGNHQSGKLNTRKLYKLKTDKLGKVFNRKTGRIDTKDFAFCILVDESGSMRNLALEGGGGNEKKKYLRTKSQLACVATTLLAKALTVAKKNFSIWGFNAKNYIHKDFGKKMSYEEMLKIEENSHSFGSGSNNDGWAIKRAVESLAKQPQPKKVLIVLSDGSPAPIAKYSMCDLRNEANKAEQIAEVYGIGIADNNVKKFYKRHIVIENPAELGKVLADIFKKSVGKRIRQ